MARELSQEAVLDFLWGAGGRAPNTELLRHFQRFLRDPALTDEQRRERREYFKTLVNSLATVHPAAVPGASKDIVLRRRYRDLLDEDLAPAAEDRQEEEEEEEEKDPLPPPRRDPDRRRGSPGEGAEKGRPGVGQLPGAAVAGGCAARGRGGPCCECRRARRAAAAPPPGPGAPLPAGPSRSPPPPARPPPYRTRPLSSAPWAPHLEGPPRTRPPELPSGPGVLTSAGLPPPRSSPLPPSGSPPFQTLQPPSARPARARSPPLPPGSDGSAPFESLPPQHPRGPPPTQSLPSGPGGLSPDRLPQPRSLLQPPTRMSLLKAPAPSAGPGGRAPTGLPPSPLLSSGPRVPSPTGPPLFRSLLCSPGVLPLSRSLQTLPASPSPSPPLVAGPAVLSSSRLLPAQSRSLQQLPTSPALSPSRGSRLLTPNRPTQPQTLSPPSGPEVLPATMAHPSRSPSQSPTQPPPAKPPPSQSLQPPPAKPPPSQSLQPPPATPPLSQSLQPPQGPAKPRTPASSPPAPLPVFRSIRSQLALPDEQDIPPSLSPDDCGTQPRALPSKSSPRNAPSRVPAVPLGQREHAWLVAVSAGRWARVRGLFLEEPELALQKDFMSGFTVLHWLAKHGDGPGLQELAAAARQAGLALDVDARTGCGYTPLHLAAIHGHQLVIKVLVLQLGCQVQVRDSSGRRPWEYLGSSTSGEIWQLLEAPRGTIMFPTQPLALSVSSASKGSVSAGRAALPACLRPQHGRRAASHSEGD
ncbi:ankyrin repeat domain-containing protein SOWAHB [Heliangelus exortis]|uniref:ankyrin repeat domain-containing protein SOWAHB n=1 Tax=Heliangelus exortis TaxID=472823 RepID=UPI003A912DD0